MSLKRFVGYYILFAAILAGLVLGISALFPDMNWLSSRFWLIFGFLGGLTLIAYVVAFLGIKRNPESGVLALMGSIVLKLLFSMAFVLIYSLKYNGEGLVFVLNFFSLYLLFTLFEISCLLRNLRHQNKK
ncbi:hypothetical protein D9M68_819760 [compost metagenome]